MKHNHSTEPSKNNRYNAKRITKVLLAIVITLLLIAAFANFSVFDETLDPEIEQSLIPAIMPPDNENAYFAIWGLAASEGKDTISAGMALDQYYKSKTSNTVNESISDEKVIEIMGGINLDEQWGEQIKHCTSRKELRCTSKLSDQLINNPLASQRLTLMLSRYRELIKLSEFQSSDGKTMASTLPPYGNLMKLRRINLAMAIQKENPLEFITILNNDMTFWKMLLENGDTLLDKMIAVASLWSNIQALSEYLSTTTKLGAEEKFLLTNMLQSLSSNQLNIGNAFLFEQQAFINTLKTIEPKELEMAYGLGSAPMFLLIQPNATFNDYYHYFTKPIMNLAKLEAHEFYKKINQTEDGKKTCCFKEIENLAYPMIGNIYNLGGKLLLSATFFRADDYIGRVHDLNGLLSLMRLKITIISSEITELDSIKELIDSSNEKNRYTKQPMDYDSGKNIISFECMDKSSMCHLVL